MIIPTPFQNNTNFPEALSQSNYVPEMPPPGYVSKDGETSDQQLNQSTDPESPVELSSTALALLIALWICTQSLTQNLHFGAQ